MYLFIILLYIVCTSPSSPDRYNHKCIMYRYKSRIHIIYYIMYYAHTLFVSAIQSVDSSCITMCIPPMGTTTYRNNIIIIYTVCSI